MDLLKDKFFHIFENGKIEYQGKIIGKVNENHYLIQYYDFLIGEPNYMKVKSLDFMVNKVRIYETAEEMQAAYRREEASLV
jgi:hypothetical protein